MMNLPERVSICEVGLRDGVQNEKVYPNTDQKVEILRGFIDAGYKVIEVGSFMHPKRVPQMADTARRMYSFEHSSRTLAVSRELSTAAAKRSSSMFPQAVCTT